MNLQGDLITFLKAIAGMSAKTPRIYWLEAPQGCLLPYVTAFQVAGDIGVNHSGSDGMQMARVQVDCRAATFAEARAIRDLIEAALKGYRGTMTGTTVDAVFPSNPMDFVEDTEPKTYRAPDTGGRTRSTASWKDN